MKNKFPLVSIIVTIYNSEKYIEQCIKSLNIQTYPNIEIIIIDDCSTDASLSIVKEYEKNTNNIKVHSLKENNGYLIATNLGFSLANGEYITFLDSDDISATQRIEKQINYLIKNKLDLVGTNCILINEYSMPIRKICYPSYKGRNNLNSVNCCGSSILFKKEIIDIIGVFNPLFTRIGSEDFEWLLRCTKLFKFQNMKDYLYFYRKSSQSITMDLNSIYSLERAISHKLAEELIKKFNNSCHKDYWKDMNVINTFNKLKFNLVQYEKNYPIHSTYRQLDSLMYQKKYLKMVKLCSLFLIKYPNKITSYSIILKFLFKTLALTTNIK